MGLAEMLNQALAVDILLKILPSFFVTNSFRKELIDSRHFIPL
jgi:hypothetical protein